MLQAEKQHQMMHFVHRAMGIFILYCHRANHNVSTPAAITFLFRKRHNEVHLSSENSRRNPLIRSSQRSLLSSPSGQSPDECEPFHTLTNPYAAHGTITHQSGPSSSIHSVLLRASFVKQQSQYLQKPIIFDTAMVDGRATEEQQTDKK